MISFGMDELLINIIKNMGKLEIKGKFKEDFIEWLNEAALNYNTNLGTIQTYGYTDQIDFMMKFLHNKPYGPEYKSKEHDIYSIDQMNELIEKYNYANSI